MGLKNAWVCLWSLCTLCACRVEGNPPAEGSSEQAAALETFEMPDEPPFEVEFLGFAAGDDVKCLEVAGKFVTLNQWRSGRISTSDDSAEVEGVSARECPVVLEQQDEVDQFALQASQTGAGVSYSDMASAVLWALKRKEWLQQATARIAKDIPWKTARAWPGWVGGQPSLTFMAKSGKERLTFVFYGKKTWGGTVRVHPQRLSTSSGKTEWVSAGTVSNAVTASEWRVCAGKCSAHFTP